MTQKIDVTPLSGACGAVITGVDLSEPLGSETFAAIHQALLDHQVIFFRDQNLTPDQQVAFSWRFGDLRLSEQYESLDGHPEIIEIVKEPKSTGIVGNLWHSDESFLPRPALGSLLYMIECPEFGGDTMFANQYLAYEALSDGMKDMLSRMRAVYSDASLGDRNKGRALKVKAGYEDREIYESVHPVVRTHPETGRKCLFLGRRLDAWIVGLPVDESEEVLDAVWDHATSDEFSWTHKWLNGDMVMWDNRCVMHRRDAFDPSLRRHMQRTQIVGTQPV